MGPREPYDPDRRTEIVEDERAPVRRRPPWWRERWWIWFLLLLLAVGALIGYAFWAQEDEDEEADRTVVPALVGLQEAEARARLDEAELDAEVERRESSDPEGEVIDQDPEAGAQLAEGQTVRLAVSSGEEETQTETETVVETETVEEEPEPTEMPEVVGSDFREAANTILDAGLLPTSYPVESSESQGQVLAQNPDAGTELPEGSTVRMNVSLGPGGRAEGDIPDLTGPEAEEALRTCHDAGFTCRTVERTAPDEESRGEIIDQDPAAGVRAASLSQITLFLGT